MEHFIVSTPSTRLALRLAAGTVDQESTFERKVIEY